MKIPPLAGLAAAAAFGAHAQEPASRLNVAALEPFVVTATRSPQPLSSALREVTVITREQVAEAGTLSLAELLQREALVEFRGTGGPGQPAGIFLRGAGAAQTLVLVDGLRVGSATVGTTSIENIPLDIIERIEVVKGPLSSLYGGDAMGGVVQVFTRAGTRPRFFASGGFGNDGEYRASTGFTAIENEVTYSFSAGARKVDAPSATNERAYCHDPDRDPYENAFANAQASWRWWQGETITVAGFASRGKASYDGCPDANGRFANDRNVQTLSGARLTSASYFAPWWASRVMVGQGRDELEIQGYFPSRFETRQTQASWINEFGTLLGPVFVGFETVRQEVLSDTAFSQTRRDTNSVFASVNETWQGQRLEASIRRDEDDQFGGRNTGSVSWGAPWQGVGIITLTEGRGFRAPSFFDLYAPPSDFYVPNPNLRPEQSRNTEVSVRSDPKSAWSWRLTWFDNEIEDLITYVFPTVENVRRARIKGVEANAEVTWMGVRIRGALAVQDPVDRDTGLQLQGRATRFGRLEASRAWGAWSLSGGVTASGPRFDSANESPETRLPGYGIVDATLKYRADRRWVVELVGSNLLDKRYEHAIGYDAPRRSLLLNIRFEGS